MANHAKDFRRENGIRDDLRWPFSAPRVNGPRSRGAPNAAYLWSRFLRKRAISRAMGIEVAVPGTDAILIYEPKHATAYHL